MDNFSSKDDKEVVRLLKDIWYEVAGIRARMEGIEGDRAWDDQRNTQAPHNTRLPSINSPTIARQQATDFSPTIKVESLAHLEARQNQERASMPAHQPRRRLFSSSPSVHPPNNSSKPKKRGTSKTKQATRTNLQFLRKPQETVELEEMLEATLGKRQLRFLEDMVDDKQLQRSKAPFSKWQ